MTMPHFETWDPQRGDDIIVAHRHQDGAALPILHALQKAFGHIPPEAVAMVATALDLAPAETREIITRHHDFRNTPPGTHVLKLCRAEACQSVGADALAAHAREQLQIDWHETSPDGRTTLEPIFCLGLCACAPAAMLDGKVHGNLDPKRLDTLLTRARQP